MKNYWQGINVITDNGWGDAGKGKLVDMASQHVDMVIRYNGGGNAGHTVINKHGEFKNHLMPSGIYNPKAVCILTGGVVIDPFMLAKEIEDHQAKSIKISPKNLLISQDAHMVMPWHKKRDGLKEKARGGDKIGTTGQGIGPTYSDRSNREGLRMRDLINPKFKEMFLKELNYQERLTKFMEGEENNQYYNAEELLKELNKVKKIICSMITNVLPVIWEYQKKGKAILAEGAQGALLDLELGGYPYVTSSHPGVTGFALTSGIHHKQVNKVIGTTKAYTTRVGGGPMPTELTDKTGQYIQKKGGEFGATTGRARRCGWLDIPAMKYGAKIAGVDTIGLTKLDILDGLPEVKLCIAYEFRGKKYFDLPTADPDFMENSKPVYLILKGWQKDISKVRYFNDLPANAKKYILTAQKWLKIPIEIVSVGAEREATIYLH
ncbi:MAG: adenylosuccinate synthase [Candidatus Roizmanbacteria bacterium]|nr:MAG: adenylosuccinate synthase [Candidatus Roizmanbacteria bacterium]